jgi:hypothetical protein
MHTNVLEADPTMPLTLLAIKGSLEEDKPHL